MRSAVQKLRSADFVPGFPHTSRVLGVSRVWELRPRAGRSVTRAFYRIIDGVVVIAVIGPEAQSDPRGFKKATVEAQWGLDVHEASR